MSKKQSSSHSKEAEASSTPQEKYSSSSLDKENKIETLITVGKYKNDKNIHIVPKDTLRSTYPIVNLRNPNFPDLPSSDASNKQDVIMDVYKDDEESFYSIKKMHTLNHPNILACYCIKKADHDICKLFNKEKNFTKDHDANYIMVFTEVIEGSLGCILTKNSALLAHRKNYIPSPEFAELVWTIINAIRFLHSKQMYHGNFSLWSTRFAYGKSKLDDAKDRSKVVVKLTNFIEKKDVNLEQAQLEDWFDLGKSLDYILSTCHKKMFTINLKRVKDFFININRDQIARMDECLGEFEFFVTPHDRWKLARKIYSWCSNEKIVEYLRSKYENLVPMPWNNFKCKCSFQVLSSMNSYKDPYAKKGGTTDYNTKDVIDFLRFVSGVYAHYNTLDVAELGKGLQKHDGLICEEFPYLFDELRNIERELKELNFNLITRRRTYIGSSSSSS